MEKDKKGDEVQKWQVMGESEVCPCHTIEKGTVWSEDQWEKHWKDRRVDHQNRIERLHKGARE